MQGAGRNRLKVACLICLGMGLVSLGGVSPSAAAQEEGAPAVQGLADMAPAGTWGVLLVDMTQVLASEPISQMQAAGAELPPQFTGMRAMAFFLLPAELPIGDDGPPWCGIILVDPQTRDAWQSRWAEDGSEITVEGATAYETGDTVKGFVADDALVLAGTQESFAALLKVYRAGKGEGLSQGLQVLLRPHAGSMAIGAAAVPESLGRLLPEEEVQVLPPYLQGITEVAFGAQLDQRLKISALARMASPEDAKTALAAAEEQIAQAKEAMNEQIRQEPMVALFMQPAFTVLGNLKMDTDGPVFHGAVELEQGQIGMLGSVGMLPYLLMGGLGFHSSAYDVAEEDADMEGIFNLHEIGLGIAMWRTANNDDYPPDLAVLVGDGYLDDADALTDPADDAPQPIGESGIVTSYEYVGPVPGSVPPETILCYSRKGIRAEGRNVLSADMAVAFVSEEELQNPEGPARTSLRGSYNAVVAAFGDTLTEERRAQLRKFYGIED